MTGFLLFMKGRGFSRPWVLTYITVSLGALLLKFARSGLFLNEDMAFDDAAHLPLTIGVIACSYLLALLLQPEVPWRESSAVASLWKQRFALLPLSHLLLYWPFLGGGALGTQIVALGSMLLGTSCFLHAIHPRLKTLPQLFAVLASFLPGFLPVAWNPVTPSQRGASFLLVAATASFVGGAAYVLAANKRPAPRSG